MGFISFLKGHGDSRRTSKQSNSKESRPLARDGSKSCDICREFRPDPFFAAQKIEYPLTSQSIQLIFDFLLPKPERRKWVQIEHGKLDSEFSDEPAPAYPTLQAWNISSQKGCQSCSLIERVAKNVHFQLQMKNKWGFSSQEEIDSLHCTTVSISNGPLQLIFVNATQRRGRDRFALLELHGIPGMPKMHPLIGNRPLICGHNNDEDAVRKILRWLYTCDNNHKCVLSRNLFSYMPRRLLRLDVANSGNHELPALTLVENVEPEKYAALSYCWGSNKASWVTTTSSNIGDHLKSVQSNSRRLPNTINDMALLVSKLGIRYLWVDALCIIQGCADDWNTEAAQMSEIYSNAYIVICADVSDDCSKSAAVPQIGGNLLSTIILDLVETPAKLPQCLSFPGWRHHEQFAEVLPAYLDSRGWTLQERLLPQRYIRLTDYEMYWECLETGLICECSEPYNEDGHFDGPLSNGINENSVTDVGFFHSSHSNMSYSPVRSALIHPKSSIENRNLAWQGVVEEYSRRNLSEESDKLLAISGVARKLGQSLDSQNFHGGRQFYAGLWIHNLIQELAWEVVGFQPRMTKGLGLKPGESPRPVSLVLSQVSRQDQKDYVAPSWSWASSNYPVKYQNQPGDAFKKLLRFLPSAKLTAATVKNSREDEYGSVTYGQLELTGKIDRVELRAARLPSKKSIEKWGLQPGRDIVL